jgi:phage baseplate assembly protein W
MANDILRGNEFIGTGWSFPPAFDLSLQGVLMTEMNDDIENSLEILLTTRIGERVMEPEYGCNMDDLMFEALDPTMATLIKDRIQTAILYFEPRITVENIEIDTTGELEGRIIATIEYTIRTTNSRFNFVYPFYYHEGTELSFLTTNNPEV